MEDMFPFTFISFFVLFGVICVVWVVIVAIYRLLFHPLASFPGPKLAALTDYWEFYQDYLVNESGNLFLELDNLHSRYGPIVRIRPNEVHVKDSQWMHVLYSGSSDPRDRDPLVGTAIGTPLATIGTGPAKLHRMRKAAIQPFFSPRSVKNMEPALQTHTAKLIENMKSQVGQVLDMRVYMFAWTTDFITDTIFNDPTNLFWNENRANDWFKIVWDFSGKFPLTKHMPWLVTTGLSLPITAWRIICPSLVPYISVYKNLLQMANKAIWKSHRELELKKTTKIPPSPLPRRDIFDTILSSALPDQDKSPKRIANEVFNLLIAGSLTTAKTATIAVFHVLNNPAVLERLQTELSQAIPEYNAMPSVKELQRLPELTAVIKETMRIGCVVTTRFPMIARHKELVHGKCAIPAGSAISMTFCKAAMDPNIFPKPSEFRPERWLDGSQAPNDYDHYVLPFGRGSRACIGKDLSYAQLHLVISAIFRFTDLHLFETTLERDIEVKGGGPLGEPTRNSKGVRVRVVDTKH